MDLRECIRNKTIKIIKIDKSLINSLLKTSSMKVKTQEILDLNETTANSKITLTYDALRGLLEALAIAKGYKIYNHECYVPFLKEALNESSLGDKFDKFRKVRNSINYYGKEITIGESEVILKELLSLIKTIRKQFFENDDK